MNHSEFETKAILTHGHRYDYSKSEVTTSKAKVEIRCLDHGPFMQAPDHHIRGRGCPECAKSSRLDKSQRTPNSPEEFFSEAARIHKGFYDYSSSVFTLPSSKIEIVCPIHGPFSTLARKHLQEKRGCPSCGKVRTRYAASVFFQDFFDAAVSRHGYAYSYANTSIRYLSDTVEIACVKHGSFSIQASRHIQGQGCPVCKPSGSTPENEMADFIESLGFTVVRNCRKIISPLELDAVVPERRIAFEFNGIFWHSEQGGKAMNYHQQKTIKTKRAGYRLFHVYESDWDLNRKIMENKIKAILNPPECPDLSKAYVSYYDQYVILIYNGEVICSLEVENNMAVNWWSPYGLDALKMTMRLTYISSIKSRLDWPEFSAHDFVKAGFKKSYYIDPERLYFDKRTKAPLSKKPELGSGLEYLSVVDSGSTVWNLF